MQLDLVSVYGVVYTYLQGWWLSRSAWLATTLPSLPQRVSPKESSGMASEREVESTLSQRGIFSGRPRVQNDRPISRLTWSWTFADGSYVRDMIWQQTLWRHMTQFPIIANIRALASPIARQLRHEENEPGLPLHPGTYCIQYMPILDLLATAVATELLWS